MVDAKNKLLEVCVDQPTFLDSPIAIAKLRSETARVAAFSQEIAVDIENALLDAEPIIAWLPIATAPKGATANDPCKEHWILGIDKHKQQKAIRWCMEYPYEEGCWMFAYEPSDYISGIQTFDPVSGCHYR